MNEIRVKGKQETKDQKSIRVFESKCNATTTFIINNVAVRRIVNVTKDKSSGRGPRPRGTHHSDYPVWISVSTIDSAGQWKRRCRVDCCHGGKVCHGLGQLGATGYVNRECRFGNLCIIRKRNASHGAACRCYAPHKLQRGIRHRIERGILFTIGGKFLLGRPDASQPNGVAPQHAIWDGNICFLPAFLFQQWRVKLGRRPIFIRGGCGVPFSSCCCIGREGDLEDSAKASFQAYTWAVNFIFKVHTITGVVQ